MEFDTWERYYTKILNDFGFSRKEDEASALMLKDRLQDKHTSLEDVRTLIENRDVWVIGNSPTLSAELKNKKLKGTILAADDAVSILLANDIRPQIIVSDLDGNVDDILHANEQGSIVLVHAHGDNQEAVKRYTPLFKQNIIGTTQSKPFDDIHNFGGFTDGDRAVFLADHFSAKKIRLLGFDFENVNEGKDDERKRKKLDWAYKLIQSLNNPNIIF